MTFLKSENNCKIYITKSLIHWRRFYIIIKQALRKGHMDFCAWQKSQRYQIPTVDCIYHLLSSVITSCPYFFFPLTQEVELCSCYLHGLLRAPFLKRFFNVYTNIGRFIEKTNHNSIILMKEFYSNRIANTKGSVIWLRYFWCYSGVECWS